MNENLLEDLSKDLSQDLSSLYLRDTQSHLPESITRESFLKYILEISYGNDYSCDTIITAITISDYFINYTGERSCYVFKSYSEPISQIYSLELAYVTLIIAAKVKEEVGKNVILTAILLTENNYVRKMEWEICMLINFHIQHYNILTFFSIFEIPIANIMWKSLTYIFIEKSHLLQLNPKYLFLSLLLLHKRKKINLLTGEINAKITELYDRNVMQIINNNI